MGIILSIFLSPSVGGGEITGVANVEKIARLTGTKGSDSINPTWEVGIGGVDLGHMINHNERTYFVFGDSFESELPHRNKPGTGVGWRWNTMCYTTDTQPADGITFTHWITDSTGKARPIIQDRRHDPITNIPTGGISVDNTLIIWYMAMKFWGNANDPCWQSHHVGLAYSDDDGTTFIIKRQFTLPGTTNFGMVSAARGNDDPHLGDGYIYIWGTPTNRLGGVKLARVKSEHITNLNEYLYFGGMKEGAPLWSDSEECSPLIVPPPVGEMSVIYNRWAGMWIMMHFTFVEEPVTIYTQGKIVLRQAPAPWGPWSEPIDVTTHETYPLLYGSYMNPRYVENHGESVYFTMSMWEPYDVYWMKVTFKGAPSRGSLGKMRFDPKIP